ncbi:MAG: SPOR domain-containing protein [Rhizobiales bacterium]|nr:SPOR domain-containing protein [Hyphomicrobiales bacterium]
MIFKNMKLSVLFFTVGLLVLTCNSIVVRANAALDQAATALNQGKYKQVVRSVGQIIGSKAKADVVAKALLYRGIAYRNQGKVAQAIADFSNAEWVRKLKGPDLRRLYAERALAYDVVGQKALAAKDRQLAGAKNVELAQRASVKNGISLSNNAVRQTSVEASKSTTQELFGGLQNLFGFNNNKQEQKIVVKKPDTQQGTGVNDPGFREIPTLESAEAKKNAAKLKTAALPPKQKVDAGASVNGVPSNSAWAAKRVNEIKATQKQSQEKLKQVNGLTTGSPVKLQPKKVKEPENTNVVGNFFNNIFGGGTKKEAPPVNPGDDVIVAEQVVQTPDVKEAPIQARKPVTARKAVQKKPLKKVAPKRKPAQRTRVAAVSQKKKPAPKARSLYHVRLGAFGEAGAAEKFVNRLNSKYKTLVGNKTAMVVETDLGNSRRQYQVFLGPYRSREKGNKTCSVLTRLGLGCSLVE